MSGEGISVSLHILVHDELLEGEQGQVDIGAYGPTRLWSDHFMDRCEENLEIVRVGYRIGGR